MKHTPPADNVRYSEPEHHRGPAHVQVGGFLISGPDDYTQADLEAMYRFVGRFAEKLLPGVLDLNVPMNPDDPKSPTWYDAGWRVELAR